MESGMPPTIQSMQNPRIKQAVKLREGRARRKSAEFLIDGATEILRAVEHGWRVTTIFVEDAVELSPELEKAVGWLRAREPQARPLQPVAAALLAKLSYGERQAAPVAIATTPSLPLSAIELMSSSLVLVLDRIEKPGNLGACLRTAAACGVQAVILTNPIGDLFNPNTIRSSRGAIFTVPLAIARPEELLDAAAACHLPLYTARVDGPRTLWECDLRGGSAVVVGNEAAGLGDDWIAPGLQAFRIPMSDRCDSLNVSISAAVTLYEAVRQRSSGKFDGTPPSV